MVVGQKERLLERCFSSQSLIDERRHEQSSVDILIVAPHRNVRWAELLIAQYSHWRPLERNADAPAVAGHSVGARNVTEIITSLLTCYAA